MDIFQKKEGYQCQCECGTITKARSWSLKTGRHASCGCLQRELLANRMLKPDYASFKHEIYKNYKRAAKKRDYEFTLTKPEFIDLIQNDCHYCGGKPSMTWHGTKRTIVNLDGFRYNGVDRVDNTDGYIIGNVVSCCKICNNSKNTLTVDEWLEWVTRVYEFQKNKN